MRPAARRGEAVEDPPWPGAPPVGPAHLLGRRQGWGTGLAASVGRGPHRPPGRTVTGPAAAPTRFADFAAWRRQTLTEERIEGSPRHWVSRLTGIPTVLELPADVGAPRSGGRPGADGPGCASAGVVTAPGWAGHRVFDGEVRVRT
ncbi:hypothetical protein C1701_25675 [Actinoalloteichus sp. AHMU CJ021]|nr:hypothetical protein C1701_25675 [Actinoalloteichus sp. AHMU CJ021]